MDMVRVSYIYMHTLWLSCCRRFSLHGTHLVDALRHFLESFRLPGESPVIGRILETFSEHWLVILHSVGWDQQSKMPLCILLYIQRHIILMGEVHGHLHTEQLVSMPGVSPSLLANGASDGPQCARSGRPMVIPLRIVKNVLWQSLQRKVVSNLNRHA